MNIHIYHTVVTKWSAWKTITNKYTISYNRQWKIYLILYSKNMMDTEMQRLINELHTLTLNEIYVYLNVVAKYSAWKTMTNKYVTSYNMQENIY